MTGARLTQLERLLFRLASYTYSPATAAVIAMEAAICAVLIKFRHKREAPTILCGTTLTSPASSRVERTSRSYQSPERRPITAPLARIMNISLRFAISVAPPARCKYQPADFPGTKVMAEEL